MSRKKEVVKLIGVTTSENSIGDSIETQTEREVLAERISIGRVEFYQADATGLRPQWTFVIWTNEYEGETKLEHDKKLYTVIRTYDKDEKEIELTCEGLVGVHNAPS